MSPPEFQSRQGPLLQKVESLLDQQVSVSDQDALLEVYEQFLHRIWERIMPTLGGVTVLAIVERSLVVTSEQYPSINTLHVSTEGLDFLQLREQAAGWTFPDDYEGLKQFIFRLMDILVALTGDILVQQLIRQFEEESQGQKGRYDGAV
jgi:hypothetical protein